MAASVELKRGEDQIEVLIGGKPFSTYYFHKDAAKPYLMPLRTPSGVIVSWPFPVFNDVSMADRSLPGFEPHQRPLYFNHGDIDGVDFWVGGCLQLFIYFALTAWSAAFIGFCRHMGSGTRQSSRTPKFAAE